MKSCKVFASISPYLISEETWNIMKLRPSQRRTRDPEQNICSYSACCGSNMFRMFRMFMLRIMKKCENGRWNFSASFRVVALKLTELIRFAFPNQWFSSISYVPLHRSDVIVSNRFPCVQLASTSLSLFTLAIIACNTQVVIKACNMQMVIIACNSQVVIIACNTQVVSIYSMQHAGGQYR